MRAIFNAGHYTHASGLEFQQDVFEMETRERLLALIDSYGVVSGYGFDGVSSPNNPQIKINQGLAYDGSGRTVRTTQAQVIAGYTTLTGLTSADVNKVMVMETTLSGVEPEAHPITGDITYTKYVDVPEVSLVVSGAVDVSKHVRIGRIYQVIEGAGAHVGATSSDSRDILSYPTTAPFIVVGPEGDPVADYTGNDATPFNDALNALKSSSNGGVIAVRPGTYTIDAGDSVIVTDMDAVKFIGMGLGTVIEGTGSSLYTDPKWKVSNVGEFTFENMHVGDSAVIGSFMRVVDTEKFVFRGNRYGPGGTGPEYGITFSSGITWVKIENNQIITTIGAADTSFVNFLGVKSGVKSMIVRNNDLRYANFWVDGTVENLIITNNDFSDSRVSVALRLSPTVFTQSQPKRTIIANNSFEQTEPLDTTWNTIESNASGTIVNANTFNNASPYADVLFEAGSVAAADYSLVNNNTFINTFDITVIAYQIGISTDKCVVRGNTLLADGLTIGINLGGSSSNCIIDSNVFAGHSTHIQDNGTSNWAGNTDNTSNKEL